MGEDAQSASRAAVDVGSNSVRLLVVDADGGRITREMAVTRLATGVDRTGHLDDAALRLTVDTIAGFRDVWRSHGVRDRVRIAATSAVRDAEDRDRFFSAVEDATGIRAEVLSGEQEAALAFAGATAAVEVTSPVAVVDIGGGSTELIVGTHAGEVAGSVSLQLGCVRLTERAFVGDPPGADEVTLARTTIAEQLRHADCTLAGQGLGAAGVRVGDAASVVAVAGTATTVGALYLDLDAYREERIHGARVPAAALTGIADRLLGMDAATRAALGPMQLGREGVIHAGALILATIAQYYDLDEVVVSESDSLDGLVASLA